MDFGSVSLRRGDFPRPDIDPATALKGAIHRPRTKHAKPLSRDEIADFAQALKSYGGYRTTVIALRLMLLNSGFAPRRNAHRDLERINSRSGRNGA